MMIKTYQVTVKHLQGKCDQLEKVLSHTQIQQDIDKCLLDHRTMPQKEMEKIEDAIFVRKQQLGGLVDTITSFKTFLAIYEGNKQEVSLDEAMQGAFPHVAQWLEAIDFINVIFKSKDDFIKDLIEKADDGACKLMDYLFEPDDDKELVGEIAQSLLEEEMANMYNQWFAMFHQRMDILEAFIDSDESPHVMEESFHDDYYAKHRIGTVGMYQYDHYKLCLDELKEQQGDQVTFQLTKGFLKKHRQLQVLLDGPKKKQGLYVVAKRKDESIAYLKLLPGLSNVYDIALNYHLSSVKQLASALVGEEEGVGLTEEEKAAIERALAPYCKVLHEEAEGCLLELKEAVEKMCVIGLKCSCVDAIQKVL